MACLKTLLCSVKVLKKSCPLKVVSNYEKTSNPNTPYIYQNGFKDFEIAPILTIQGNDSTYINELRFNAVFSAMYTKKLMFDKFGKWDKEIRPNNERHPILVWEKIKLFDNKNKVYSIATYGAESMEGIYASVIIFDSKNKDCLTENNSEKDSIISFFPKGIQNLSSNKKFYNIYWKMVKGYNKNNR